MSFFNTKKAKRGKWVVFFVGLLFIGPSGYAKSNIFKKLIKVALTPQLPLPNLLQGAIGIKGNIDHLGENFHAVEANKFYRSAQLSPKILEKYIKKHQIKTVINLRGAHPEEAWWQKEKAACDANQVKLFDISMSAKMLTSKENLLKLLGVYDTACQPILIHCYSGADRTGEAAALWCLEKMGQSKKDAVKQLSPLYGHFQARYPEKDRLIQMWGGREWLGNEYRLEGRQL